VELTVPDATLELSQTVELPEGAIAWDVYGHGPPVVLVHGTPTSSYLWRRVAPVLSETFSVYVFDLLGYGRSRAQAQADVSLPVQGSIVIGLLDHWGVQGAGVVGHDIGGAAVLRAHLIDGVPFACVALLDAVVTRPWITATTRHVQAHLDAYKTMPGHVYKQIVATHLRTAVHGTIDDATLEAYLSQWTGADGQAAYLRKVELFDEEHTTAIEARLGEVKVPVRVIWGQHDAWLPIGAAERVVARVPTARLTVVPDAGHFVMEDQPQEVARLLHEFFASCLIGDAA